ncbi:MAG: phosphatidylserine decarboxylase family protein [Candidatus Brocadiia bacterium]
MRIPLAGYGIRELLLGSMLCAAAVGFSLWFFWPLALPCLAVWVWLISFFRDPDRECPQDENALLSPADGTVMDIETVDPPADYLEGPVVRVGIFMSIFNVHVNRSPAAGTVGFRRYVPGTFRDARDNRAATENEHNLLGLERPDGRRIMVNQIAGAVARRIVCAVEPGDSLAAAERFGMIKFGSRLELFVPQNDKVAVKVATGDKVKAGRDVLVIYKPTDQE